MTDLAKTDRMPGNVRAAQFILTVQVALALVAPAALVGLLASSREPLILLLLAARWFNRPSRAQ
ncbi:hypothetical protein [Nonomuraea sp. NPDC050643]|uniref:hypothetical protein n=1 Tax=Nonomuraea sp. NPDC050643 TaxID=3155660 RepID=UPI0033ECEA38